MATNTGHGEEVLAAEGVGKLAEETVGAHESGIHVALSAEKLGDFYGFPITNTLITTWVVVVLLITLGVVIGRHLSLVPGRLQTLAEMLFGGIYDYVAETLESQEMARRFFPLLMTIFLFVFTANAIALLPGVGSIGIYHDWELVGLLRSVNTDLNIPLALALISFFVIEITGIVTLGFFKYGSKFIANPIRSPLAFAVGLVELIGELVRVVSLSFRLFGNILAGKILILVAFFFVPYFLPVPLMAFELFVGFLQAAIFSLLTLFFIKLAITDHSAEHAH